MCGIIGVAGPDAAEAALDVERGLAHLSHRGPDAESVEILKSTDLQCVFGHARLRIIDTSPAADEPLPNEDKTVWLTFNGEIYNFKELREQLVKSGHTFRSQTDGEVIVHLYEEVDGLIDELLERLRGMFAFALFDTRRGVLVLARDRLGIKPMYYSHKNSRLGFSSEVRALRHAGFASEEVDRSAVADFMLWGVVRGPKTILADVSELPPGHYVRFTGRDLTARQWWTPVIEADLDGDAARSALTDAVRDAVARHLVADVPVGVFLSGGIDSRVVAALAGQVGETRSLTVTFPEVGGDEGEEARVAAEQFGLTHSEVVLTGSDAVDQFPRIVASMDQPTTDGVNTWFISRAAREAGLTVALSGLGGDELFGGYGSFRQVPKLARWGRVLGLMPRAARMKVARLVQRGPGDPLSRALGVAAGYAGAYRTMRGLLGPIDVDRPEAASALPEEPPSRLSDKDKVMLLEMGHYLRNQLLRDTDQMSMAHSLEVRVPLLDDRVVATALRAAAEVRYSPGKATLAAIADLPAATEKRGFTLPFDAWMRGPLSSTMQDALLTNDLPFADVIDSSLRTRVWESFERRQTHWSKPWALAVLRLWPGAAGIGSR